MEFPFPIGGLNENTPAGKQPRGTTSLARNVRSTDPVTGRERGAQRSGLSRYYHSQLQKNLLSVSEDLTDDAWIEVGGPNVTGGQADFDGGFDAFLVADTRNDVVSAIYQDIPGTSAKLARSVQVTASVRIARNSSVVSRFPLTALGGTEARSAKLTINWDSSDGTISSSSFTTQGGGTFDHAVELLGDSRGFIWYRIWISMTWDPTKAFTALRFELQPDLSVLSSLAAYFDHPQLEIGSSPTIYQGTNDVRNLTIDPRGQNLTSITYSQKTLDFSQRTDPLVEWRTKTPLQGVPRDLQVDGQGNSYALDGNSVVVKYNGAGAQIWRIDVPRDDEESTLETLLVDEFGGIYTGTTGGDEPLAKLYKYSQLPFDDEIDEPEDRTRQDWAIPIGGSVRRIVRRDEVLLVMVDVDSVRRGVLAAYTAVDTATPVLLWSRIIPYPSNSLAVGKDGGIFTSHEPTTGSEFEARLTRIRGRNKKSPNSGPDAVDWTPDLLEESEAKIWCWLRAEDLAIEHEDGDGIEEWHDKDGRIPFLRRPLETSASNLTRPDAAIFKASGGAAGRPYVRISATNGDSSRGSYMESPGPNTTDAGQALDQSNLIPSYDGAAWAVFLVVDALDKTFPSAPEFTILGHNNGSETKALVGNRHLGVQTAKGLSWIEAGTSFDVGGSDGPRSNGSAFGSTNGAVLVTIINDGKETGSTRSSWRLNGLYIDEWDISNDNESKSPWYLGFTDGGNVFGNGEMRVHEILVLDRLDRSDTLENDIIEHPAYPNSSGSISSATVLEKVEAYLMHKFGLGDDVASRTNQTGKKHPYASVVAGSARNSLIVPSTEDTFSLDELWSEGSLVIKHDSFGKIRWIMGAHHGTGYDLLSDAGKLYSTGPSDDANNTTGIACNLRQFTDDGDTFDLADGWAHTEDLFSGVADIPRHRIAVDANGNTFWPLGWTDESDNLNTFTYRVLDTSGAKVLDYDTSSEEAGSQNAHAVQVPSTIPDYEGDPVSIAETVWVATTGEGINGSTFNLDTVRRTKLVDATPNGLSPRITKAVAVHGGEVVEFEKEALTAIGAGLDPESALVQTTVLFGKLYFTDGQNYKVWTPRSGEFGDWTAESSGELPKRCALLTRYRGRAVLARSLDDPQAWFMSAIGDPSDWSYFRAVPTVDQASSGATSRAGFCPDIINALIPYSDDTLIAGGDKELWLLRGDPEEGGQWDQLSDTTGMAFGDSWCKSPEGIVFFLGSRGGAYAMIPGRVPERLTQNTIERRMREVDFTKYRPQLLWNDFDEGFHVFLIPLPGVTGEVEHFFWSQKTRSWWPDVFDETISPTAATILDSDVPDDRRLLILGGDLVIRKWDSLAHDDDGIGIDSVVRIGPLTPGGEGRFRFSHLHVVLSDASDGAEARWYVSDRPDLPRGPVLVQDVMGGRSPRSTKKVSGARVWLDIGSARSGERWSYEAAYARSYRAGRARVTR